LSKRDPLICLQEGGRFAPVVVVIFCLQKDAPVVDVIFYSHQKGGRFARVVVVICCLQKNGRFAPGVVVICSLQKGGRFAAVVVVPNCCPI
jgi:hypothetical protein